MKPDATSEAHAKTAQDAALSDWQAGKISNEFYDKTATRPFSDADVERVLKSRSSGVWQYRDFDQLRFGFWHPELELFVAWQPAEEGHESQIKTAFIVKNIDGYMSRREQSKTLRAPKR
jgi:hypothetical protein